MAALIAPAALAAHAPDRGKFAQRAQVARSEPQRRPQVASEVQWTGRHRGRAGRRALLAADRHHARKRGVAARRVDLPPRRFWKATFPPDVERSSSFESTPIVVDGGCSSRRRATA
jgi:hypothetical protein